MFRTTTTLTAICTLFAATGCSTMTTTTSPATTSEYAAQSPFDASSDEPAWQLDDDVRATVTYVDDEPSTITVTTYVAETCRLPEPKFAFDSAKVRDRAEPNLDALATCLKTGPLAGQNIKLTGHADERGPEVYNMALGQRRAGRVQSYLVSSGVDASRIETSSMGELMADDLGGYDDDRRVEVSVK